MDPRLQFILGGAAIGIGFAVSWNVTGWIQAWWQKRHNTVERP